ncbi:MAG: uracil-DNA glycosylase [Candidatus Pacebacteria bacterium]|jgi:DNA polymerase|nr:uracil-DNA glycosylase [Candidatus Paceibacterota bacterium]
MTKAEQLVQLNTKWLTECTCELRKVATQGVPGFGNPDARIVFIGEAPGAKEDKEGRPFIGAAGKFLSEMLESINMKREDIYITNIVKYRPPENRDPSADEIASCAKWLEEEINIIDPLLIVFLGRHSMNHFFPAEKISEAHGVLLNGKYFGKLRHFLPLYHPAAALYNGSLREVLKADFARIPQILKMVEKERLCDSPI